MKILAIVAYKGTNYNGWQTQVDGRSIQDAIEKVISHILNEKIHIFGAGRTDAGVHAKKQAFHFSTNKMIDLDKFRYSCNCLLPKDIHILQMQKVNDDFHARKNVKEKHYSYTIYLGENNPFNNEFSFNILRPIDVPLLVKSIKMFNGTFNFQDFTSKEEDELDFIRTIRSEVKIDGDVVRIDFYSKGFMRYMIRFIVGACIAVAEEKENLSFISEHLNNNEKRKIINYKAPAEGLFLEEVIY